MNCPNCKSQIQKDVKYCQTCGYHFPSISRGKRTFDVRIVKKIFGKKEKPTMTDPSEKKIISGEEKQKPTITDSPEKKIELKKIKKWGWGWYILAGFIGFYIDKAYSHFGDSKNILYLLGIGISLLMYFYFRNKLLKEISFLRLRSFISGFLSIIITWVVISFVAVFIAPDIFGNVSKNIIKELNIVSTSVKSFIKQETTLWSFYVDEPSTNNEIRINLKIFNKSIPLLKSKDSVVFFAYDKVFTILDDAEMKYPNKMKKYPLTKIGVASLINSYKTFSNSTLQNIITLQDYYNAMLEKKHNIDTYWNKVLIAQRQLEKDQTKFFQASKIFSDIQNKLGER